MNRRAVLAAAAAIPAIALSPAGQAGSKPARPVQDDLRALIQRQAAQWNAGDLEGFCAHYGDDAIFLSPSGRTDGRQAAYDRFRKQYGDAVAMGALTLEVLHVVADSGVASVVMKWRLAFALKAPIEGYSLIGLEQRDGVWHGQVIVDI